MTNTTSVIISTVGTMCSNRFSTYTRMAGSRGYLSSQTVS